MNCPKHPHLKMTLLFVNYVCDICQPPKATALPRMHVDMSYPGVDVESGRLDGAGFLLCRWAGCGSRIQFARLDNPAHNSNAQVTCANGHYDIRVLKHLDMIEDHVHGDHGKYDAINRRFY